MYAVGVFGTSAELRSIQNALHGLSPHSLRSRRKRARTAILSNETSAPVLQGLTATLVQLTSLLIGDHMANDDDTLCDRSALRQSCTVTELRAAKVASIDLAS